VFFLFNKTMSEQYNSSPSCQYSTLSTYNGTSFLGNTPPVPSTTVSGVYIVPSYGSIGYDALTSGVPSCSGYRNIVTAYGANASTCNQQYSQKPCNQ
jgi:hypothetical protein